MTFQIILEVLLVLASAIIVGEGFEQFGLPSVAGELLSGLMLGPTVLGLVASDVGLQSLASVSLFFIIFMIGFEMNTKTLGRQVSQGVLLSLTSFIVPLVLCVGVGLLVFPFGTATDFVVALAVSVPSISIISVLVVQYDMLQSKSGQLILASVTITDIVAFVVLEGAFGPVEATLKVIVETAAFITAFVAVDWVLNYRPSVFRRVLGRVGRATKREDLSYAALILVGLAIAAVFEAIGLSYIIGAFFAGLIVHDGLIGRRPYKEVSETFSRINRAFFIPFFFGFAGVEADLAGSGLALVPAVAAVLSVSLVVGIGLTYVVAKTFKLSGSGADRQVAVVLGGRGAVGIVIASVALSSAAISTTAYSLIIVSTLVASVVVVLLLARAPKS